MQSTVTSDGDETHIVVDGQQRVRAFLEFVTDDFALGDESGDLAGSYFKDLDAELRERIWRYKFVVRTLPNLDDAELRAIFGRLNRNNVALNKQELRHATYWGDFITTMTDLSDHPFWPKSGLFNANDFRRMLDIEFVSELAVAVLYGLQNKKARLDYYYGVFESEFPDREVVRKTASTVLAQLEHILEWPNPLRWNRKIDFYSLFVALSGRVGDMPLEKLESSRVGDRLRDLSSHVGDVLSMTEDQQASSGRPSAAVTYARGVRNSSDLASLRLRDRGLREYLWGEVMPSDGIENGKDPHLARLPDGDELLRKASVEDEDDGEAESDAG